MIESMIDKGSMPGGEHGRRVEDMKKRGKVYTFYSYKGGVGRSMAMANVAVLLAKWGKRVLVVDWDLEAPGIERYFKADGNNDIRSSIRLSNTPKEKYGIVDLVLDRISKNSLKWHDCVINAEIYDKAPSLSIITAGKQTSKYPESVQNLNWNELFEKENIGAWLNELREEWIEEYDIVLIDSRTGISDIGGICTIILPDVLVLMFTTNLQSIDGVMKVMRSARSAQDDLPVDRDLLVALPVLARDESQTEYDRSEAWRDRIADKMAEFLRDWLMRKVTPRDVLQKLYIPYVAYWSFGERLPVFEKEEELEDPRKIGAAYARLATLIENQLDWKVMDRYGDPHELTETRVELQQKEEEVESLNVIVKKLQEQLLELQENAKKQNGKQPISDVRLRIFYLLISIGVTIAIAGIIIAVFTGKEAFGGILFFSGFFSATLAGYYELRSRRHKK